MAIFLGARGGDILTWRNVSELASSLKGRMAERMSYLLAGEDMELMEGWKERLDEEIAFEKEFAADFAKALDDLERASDGLMQLRERLNRMAAGYFERRRSVVALHALCTAFQDRLICRVLRTTEEWMEQNGFGNPPAPYCWLVSGSLGRLEGSLSGNFDSLMVFGETESGGASYFEDFSRRAAAALESLGMKSRTDIIPAHPSWRGSMADWRLRLNEGLSGERRNEAIACLVTLADLRHLYGDEGTAAEMTNLVRGLLDYHRHGALRDISKSASEMPIGLDFFGRLRVDKSGNHRGEFNLEQFALTPLIMNICVMAIRHEVAATGTVDRIKGVLERGRLGVELAERLLMAYHDFASLKVFQEIRGGAAEAEGVFLNPDDMSEAEERNLKNGMEAVVNLQRIVYQTFAEQ
ncbi:MAG: hypothetical protein FD174_1299 [Geobacteraceae bacterium]|nr:MAG: hypothetical protein FD174_1299 [Geobacteraceae bacterium]